MKSLVSPIPCNIYTKLYYRISSLGILSLVESENMHVDIMFDITVFFMYTITIV